VWKVVGAPLLARGVNHGPDPFAYRPPEPGQVASYEVVADVMSHAYRVILQACPRSAERTLAIRDLQRARMWANAAIAFKGEAIET
jgi:hypothetical protein